MEEVVSVTGCIHSSVHNVHRRPSTNYASTTVAVVVSSSPVVNYSLVVNCSRYLLFLDTLACRAVRVADVFGEMLHLAVKSMFAFGADVLFVRSIPGWVSASVDVVLLGAHLIRGEFESRCRRVDMVRARRDCVELLQS